MSVNENQPFTGNQQPNPSHPWVNKSIEEDSSFINKLTFFWTRKLVFFGFNKPFQQEDLFEVRKDEKFEWIKSRLLENYPKLSLAKAILKISPVHFWVAVICNMIAGLLGFAAPILMSHILTNFATLIDPPPIWHSYVEVVGIFIAFVLKAIFSQQGSHYINSVALKAVASLEYVIHHKCLNLASSSRNHLDVGSIVNRATVDVSAIYNFTLMFSNMVSGPVVLIVAIALIVNQIGNSGFIVIAVLLASMMFFKTIAKQVTKSRIVTLKQSDKRTKSMIEYITGIKILKFFGWEEHFMGKIDEIRQVETSTLLSQQRYRALIDMYANMVPYILAIATFGIYIAGGNTLTTANAFSTLAYFNVMQTPMRMMTYTMYLSAQAGASMKRIAHFLGWEDYDNYRVEDNNLKPGQLIMKDGTFAWDTEKAKEHSHAFDHAHVEKEAAPDDIGETYEDLAESNEDNQHTPKKPKEYKDVILKNINLQVNAGEFVALVGEVGSGKTSLLASLLGEMVKLKGDVRYNGRIAYVPQQAWLRNATVRDNILFGLPFERNLYKKVIQLCELEEDLKVLPGADLTEVGERGLNLSGGQKQRVAIARALYSQADLYLIDDALSALDAQVGQRIFRNVFLGELKGKTILFVTHELRYTLHVDKIIVMQQGTIVEQGKYDELRNNRQEFVRLSVEFHEENIEEEELEIEQYTTKREKEDSILDLRDLHDPQEESLSFHHEIDRYADLLKEKETALVPDRIAPKKVQPKHTCMLPEAELKQAELQKIKEGKIVFAEQKQDGPISWNVFKAYFLYGGKGFAIGIIIILIVSQGIKQVNDWWLSAWSGNYYHFTQQRNILIYFLAAIGTAYSIMARGFLFGRFSRHVALNSHRKLLESIFKAPLSWFDTTPTGRIINRSARDQDEIDNSLPWTLQFAAFNSLMIIGALISIGIVITQIFFAFVAFGLPYYIINLWIFIRASRECKRIERNAVSPIIHIINETASGMHVFRAYGKQEMVANQMGEKIDFYIKATSNGYSMQRWVGLRTDWFSTMIMAATFLFGVYYEHKEGIFKAPLVGLAFGWALSACGLASYTTKLLGDLFLGMSAVERNIQYTSSTEQEAEWGTKKNVGDWCKTGKIEAVDVRYRYRKGLPEVIHGINFSIKSFEKIGVCGRSGSGKSTLALGLLRVLELDDGMGSIKIDDLNIAELGLHDLRHQATIIPQDPVLFNTTLRENIDPYHDHKDEEVIEVLKRVHAWDQLKFIGNEKDRQVTEHKLLIGDDSQQRLNYMITDGGSNISLGQKQLICMARALIRKPKLLIMDEATANIDEMTDRYLQNMIKTEMRDSTVFTIAHRLSTIIQYDRILVLDKGTIVEFDTPVNLLKKEGHFTALVKEAGPEFEKELKYLASHKE